MSSKVYFRRKMAHGRSCENHDSMTLVDAIRTGKNPAPKQWREQQQARRTDLFAEGEANFREGILAATDFSSGSNGDVGRVFCQYKRRKKCMDLCDILKREPSVVDHSHDEYPPSRKPTNLEPIGKGHVVSPNANGRRKITAKSRPPASFPTLKAGRKTRSSSRSKKQLKSASEADLLPVSGYSLHTCADAKNCQNACVANAVAPHLDHMSEEELIYWYGEVTKSKFTHRNGEKVRGRIRRVIRAEAKRAAAPTMGRDGRNNSNKSVLADELQESNSPLEPSTPSPAKLVIDLRLEDSPGAPESPTSSASKEKIPCAFNSAAPFNDDLGEEKEKTSSNRSEAVGVVAPFLKDDLTLVDSRLDGEEDLAECQPMEIPLVTTELSVVRSAEDKRVPTEALVKLESDWRDSPSPAHEDRSLTVEQRGELDKLSRSDRLEEQSLLLAVESESPPSIGTVASHPQNVELKVSEGFEPVLSAFWIVENGSTSHQHYPDSTRESMDCAHNSDTSELPEPVADEANVQPIMQLESEIVDLTVRSGEDKLSKTEYGMPPSLIATKVAFLSPNLRPHPPPREQGSAVSQYRTLLLPCDAAGVPTGHKSSGTSSRSNSPGALVLEEVTKHLEPNNSTPIEGNSKSAAGSREESTAESSQGELLSDSLFNFQETAPPQRDQPDEIVESAEGVSVDSETSQQIVDISLVFKSQRSVDRVDQLLMGDTSSRAGDVEMPIQDESQISCLVEEQNTFRKLGQIGELSLENKSRQAGSSPARSDTSRSGDIESGKGIEGLAETRRTICKGEGIDGERLATCHGSLMQSGTPVDEMGSWDAGNVPTIPNSTGRSDKEDCVLSLEEYIAVHRGDDAVFPRDLEEHVLTQELEEDVASELVKSQSGSGEEQDATKDAVVGRFAAQQMFGSVACCQKPDRSNDHVEPLERIPSLNGISSDAVALVPLMKDVGFSLQVPDGTRNNSGEEFSAQELATNLPSLRFREEECKVQNEAEAEAAPAEINISTPQDLDRDGTVAVTEKEVLPCPEDCNTGFLDGAVSSLYVEEDVTLRKVMNCANQPDRDVTVSDPEEDVGCKAKVMTQRDDSGGTASEDYEVLAAQEIFGIASEQQPQEVLMCSSIEADTTPQESYKNKCAPCLDKLGVSQRRPDEITEELAEESCSPHHDNHVMQGGNEMPRASECGVENLNHAATQVAGVPHSDDDNATRRMEEAALQSLEGNASSDHIADISESCLPGSGSTQSLQDVDYLDQMDSTVQLGEDGASEHVEDVDLQPAQGLGESNDRTGSPDYLNSVTEGNDVCQKASDDSLEYPVVLSQPRRRESEDDDIQETVCDAQRMPQINTPVFRRITRASLKLDKSIQEVVENLVDCFKLSSPQCSIANSILPREPFNCASAWDSRSNERNKPSVLATAEKSCSPIEISSPVSEAEIEQIDNFVYAMLQEEEWQNAGKFSNQIDMSFFEEDVALSSPRKRKFNDQENVSGRGKRIAVESPLHEVALGSVPNNATERVTEQNAIEDDYVPTALSKAKIERNVGRRGGLYTSDSSADQESPVTDQHSNVKQRAERRVSREKRKVLLEHSPELNCNTASTIESNDCIDLLACEKLGEEASSQDFEPPSKLLCRRQTISPLSQLELMRASNIDSPPSDDSQRRKISAFMLKLPPGQDGHREGPSPFKRESTPDCISLEPSDKTGKEEANTGCVVFLDSSEDDTDDSYYRQELGSRRSGGEPPRTFSLCLSPTSPSPESVRTDSSPNVASQEPRDSRCIGGPSSKGILKPTQSCKVPCKCSTCSTSRFTAGNAAGFVASQMKTFQLIAGSLTKELQGLRSIIETNLSNPGELIKIPETLKKCKDVEEAAQKSLATLRRDCKRYCKLVVTKPIRRISFADEAGKKLCHVKTFRNNVFPN